MQKDATEQEALAREFTREHALRSEEDAPGLFESELQDNLSLLRSYCPNNADAKLEELSPTFRLN